MLGRVADIILHYENLELCGLVIKDSGDESVKKIKDDDEQILPIEYITEIRTDGVYLNATSNFIDTVKCEEMERKAEVMRFSELTKLPIYDQNNDDVGRIDDIYYLDKIFVQMEIDPRYFENLAARYKAIEGMYCGADVEELDISSVDIHVKMSDREIERRIKIVMNTEFEKEFLNPDLLKKEEGELRIQRLKNLLGNIR